MTEFIKGRKLTEGEEKEYRLARIGGRDTCQYESVEKLDNAYLHMKSLEGNTVPSGIQEDTERLFRKTLDEIKKETKRRYEDC